VSVVAVQENGEAQEFYFTFTACVHNYSAALYDGLVRRFWRNVWDKFWDNFGLDGAELGVLFYTIFLLGCAGFSSFMV